MFLEGTMDSIIIIIIIIIIINQNWNIKTDFWKLWEDQTLTLPDERFWHVRMVMQAPWLRKSTNLIGNIHNNAVEQPKGHEHSDRLRAGSHPDWGCD